MTAALALAAIAMTHQQPFAETAADHERRMAWFREARFGMFIHWGLYAVPGGAWRGKNVPGAAEWLMYSAQIPVKDYEPFKDQFNPVKFDAERWVRIAKNAGMKYIVITSKHHDGFALWDSKVSDYDVMATPFRRDILKELAAACRKDGIRLCFYHSIMDWHHPDYLPRRPWDPRPEVAADFDRYVAYMKAQLKELLTDYGRLGILWFDGEWEDTWTHQRGKDLYAYVRGLQPDIIVNNRVDKGRGGMAGMTTGDHKGDYGTPEQEIPSSGFPGLDWESCMTMNDTWGYSRHDHNWKSAETLIKNLVDCTSKGGNYLLNVGPTELGEIPGPSVERLEAVGTWLKANGEAIYGAGAGPFPKRLPWGRVTRKGDKLYLAIFDGRATELELTGLRARITRAYALRDPKKVATVIHGSRGPVVRLPAGMPAEAVRVVVVETQGGLAVEVPVIRQDADGAVLLDAEDAVTTGSARYEGEQNKRCIGYWTDPNSKASWTFEVGTAGDFQVRAEIACDPPDAGSEIEFAIGKTILKTKIAATQGWSDFVTVDLGKVSLPAGKVTVTVRAAKIARSAALNLRSIRLAPPGRAR